MQLTTLQAAARLGVNRSRVLQLIGSGQLPARKQGRDWIITGKAVKARLDSNPKAGRPKGRK